tara:strand:+ start:106 stop:375 length:270 start_codon:yes stop_codon:yes gene_type:complete
MMKNLNALNVISWFFGLLLVTIGVMNFVLVHPIPGVFYFVVSFLFFPPTNVFLKKKFNISIPFGIKLILFILIMWPTLGVGDLAELYGL